MKKSIRLIAIVVLLFIFVGCTTHIHRIGTGPQSYTNDEERQWYVLWGLVPINEVDTKEMAGDVANYEIKTEVTPIDFLISIPASTVSVTSRTVTVTK
ncbi:Bor/Iss family lipoprotein [Candidatus Neomarinimicrobiota bacterium]